MAPGEVLSGLAGSDPAASFIVRDLRLPRALCAVLAGAALGISGAIFQSLTRNPLGSPDIVGFTYGAGAGALIVITMLGGSGTVVSAGALAGGDAHGARRLRARLHARRASPAIGWCSSGSRSARWRWPSTDFLLARARIEDAQEATRWLLGSLNSARLGGRLAAARGLHPARARARHRRTAAAGARAGRRRRARARGARGARAPRPRAALRRARLRRRRGGRAGAVRRADRAADRAAHRTLPGPALVLSALTGAALMLAADIAAQRIVPSTPLPVGVMTGAFGGLYLAWLLARGWRKAATHEPAARARGHARLRPARRHARPLRGDRRRRLHGDRRAERVRQVDAPARARADAQAAERDGAARRRGDRRRCRRARSRSGSGSSRRARRRRTASRSPTSSPAVAIRTRACCGRGRSEDARAVREAMEQTDIVALADRPVDELSGGQRQRVWLAMALAQETPLLLLDEPTTFLDIAHQLEVLDLCADLHERGRTLVAVLHDLNHACRYATQLIAMRDGVIVAQGAPCGRSSTPRWSSPSSGCGARWCRTRRWGRRWSCPPRGGGGARSLSPRPGSSRRRGASSPSP